MAELESQLSSSEFSEWIAFYSFEPFGAWRDNWHAAQLTALVYNVNRGKGNALSAGDFMYIDAESSQDKKDMEFIARLNALGHRDNG